jgi:hypothetical protein
MAEPVNDDHTMSSLRDVAEKALLAGLGLVNAAKDKAGDVVSGDDEASLTERVKSTLADLADDLGLVRRDRHEELELKVSQLEHRLRLLEEQAEGKQES